MSNFFNMDNKFFTALGRIADMIILNVIFVVCCIPIVTIGAAWTAMYYVALKMVKNEESYIIRSFLKSFKENFKQATIIWGIFLVAGIILGVDFWVMTGVTATWGKVFFYALGVVALMYAFTLAYVFPVLSRFYNTTKNTVKNAFLMSLRHLPWTILIVLITYLPLIIFFFLTQIFFVILPFWIIAGFGVQAFVSSYIFVRVFKHYMPEETETEENEFHVPIADEASNPDSE